MSMCVSKWTDRRVRVGWTIRNRAGQLGKVCWVSGGCVTYKLIQPQPEQVEVKHEEVQSCENGTN